MSGNTGTLTFASAPDFETAGDADADNGYDVTVQVSDGTQAAMQTLHVTVSNTNEAPTALQVSGGGVLERSPAGTLVATVSVADPDAGELFTFSLVTDANGRFVIDPASGRLLVSNSASLDFASASQHTLTVQVTDAGGLSHQQTVVVDVAPIVVPQELPPLTPPSVPRSPPRRCCKKRHRRPASTTERRVASTTDQSHATLRGRWRHAATGAGDGSVACVDRRRRHRCGARRAQARRGPSSCAKTATTRRSHCRSRCSIPKNCRPRRSQPTSRRCNVRSMRCCASRSGLTRGQAVQIDEPPSEPRDQSTTDAILRVVTDPVKVSSVAFTAGFVWWLTRGGGLLATMLMGIPAWRHIDLAPVLARGFDEDHEDDDEFDLLPEATEPSRLDVLSELRMRSMTEAPSFDSVLDDGDGSPAADLFDPLGSRAAASGRR